MFTGWCYIAGITWITGFIYTWTLLIANFNHLWTLLNFFIAIWAQAGPDSITEVYLYYRFDKAITKIAIFLFDFAFFFNIAVITHRDLIFVPVHLLTNIIFWRVNFSLIWVDFKANFLYKKHFQSSLPPINSLFLRLAFKLIYQIARKIDFATEINLKQAILVHFYCNISWYDAASNSFTCFFVS